MADEKNTGAGNASAVDTKAKPKLKAAEQPEVDTPVTLKETMWIEGTGGSKHLDKGTKYEVHPIAGAKLISKGAAKETSAPVKPKPAVKKVKDEDED